MFFLELTRVGPSLLAVLNSVVSKVDLQVSRDNKSHPCKYVRNVVLFEIRRHCISHLRFKSVR